VAASGLSGETGGLFVARWVAGRWRTALSTRGAATAPAILGFAGGAPRIAYRDGGGVSLLVLRSPRSGLARLQPQRLLSEHYNPASVYTGALGAAVSRTRLGVAVVAARGLLEFATVPTTP
jgi:hypothetical protein